MEKTNNISPKKREIGAETAQICGVSDDYVRKVMRMDRNNELVVTVFMTLYEKKKEALAEAHEIVKQYQTSAAYY